MKVGSSVGASVRVATGPQSFGEIQMLQCVHSPLADGSPSLSTVAPSPVKIKDAWSRRGILLLPRTHKFVHVCARDTVTFLIGIKLFFPGEKNVDMA